MGKCGVLGVLGRFGWYLVVLGELQRNGGYCRVLWVLWATRRTAGYWGRGGGTVEYSRVLGGTVGY